MSSEDEAAALMEALLGDARHKKRPAPHGTGL
jgi:hypothetical protein